MGLLGLYFLPTGRISRSRFLLGFIGLFLIEFAFSIWLTMTMFGRDYLDSNAPPLAKPAMQLALLIDLIFLFPTFVVLAKRFHDRGKGAVWSVPFLLAHLAVIGAVIVGVLPAEMPKDSIAISNLGLAVSTGWLILFVWIVIELGCLRGTLGVNRYGADPLAK